MITMRSPKKCSMQEEVPYHRPVLLSESVDGLDIKEDGVYVDVTFGGGGHSKEILRRLGDKGRLVAFDQDEDALSNAVQDERFQLINENFRFVKRFLKFYGIVKVDGILADFGVSSHQFDVAERGFSTRFDAELDMRMNRQTAKTAMTVLNTYTEEDLYGLLKTFGELRSAKGVARALVSFRMKRKIATASDLRSAIVKFLPRGKENRTLAQVFQAVRIEVNEEIQVLKEFLEQVPGLLKIGGRLSVISYHSLEDRLVKRYIRDGKFVGQAEKDFYGNISVPLRKVGGLIVPSEKEITENNRARSAKLRIAERI